MLHRDANIGTGFVERLTLDDIADVIAESYGVDNDDRKELPVQRERGRWRRTQRAIMDRRWG